MVVFAASLYSALEREREIINESSDLACKNLKILSGDVEDLKGGALRMVKALWHRAWH